MRLSPALLMAVSTACAFEPEGAEPFTPPAEYRQVWAEVQACTGRRDTRFSELRFMVVEGHSFDSPKGRVDGWTRGHTITLASDWVDYLPAVKHEMIHAAIGDDKGHPSVPFGFPCHAWMGSLTHYDDGELVTY